MIERINLLPAKHRGQPAIGRETRWFLLALALVVALLAGLTACEGVRRGTLQRRRTELINTRDRLLGELQIATAVVGRMQSLANEKAAMQARLESLGALQEGRRSWSELLVRISRVTPEGLWLTSLGSDLKGEGGPTALGLRFQGQALSHERVSELLAALERDPSFQEVLLVSTTKGTFEDREVVDFTLSCQVRVL